MTGLYYPYYGRLLVVLSLLLVPFLAWSEPQQHATKNPNIVEIRQDVAIEVISQSILRVFRCAPFSQKDDCHALSKMQERDSLVVVERPRRPVQFHVNHKETLDEIVITTDLMIATASKLNGRIQFLDRTRNNQVLIQEGAATFTTGSNTTSKSVRQDWNLMDPNEAIYGGGQFVNGLLNYRSAPIQWIQFNTEVVIPFLLSSNQYGILWDAYGVTFMNPPQQTIELALSNKTQGGNYDGTFTPLSEGDYWFHVQACHGTFGCGGRPKILQLTLQPKTQSNSTTTHQPPRTICEHNLYNMPQSIACRVSGLVKGQPYDLHLQNEVTADSTTHFPIVSYTSIQTHNQLTLETKATKVIDYYLVANEHHSKKNENNNENLLQRPSSSSHPSLDGVIANYRRLTGTAYLYNKWVYGFWQCKEHYASQEELTKAAAKFRQLHIPVDAFVQDWLYWGDLGWGPQWDPKIYPTPEAMISQLHSSDIHFMVSVWSKFDSKTTFYKTLTQAKAMIPGGSSYMDAWNPQARDLFYKFVDEAHFSIGVDALWLDATEPEGFDQRHQQIYLGSGDEYANTFSLMVSKAVYEGLVNTDHRRRVFSLTRSSFAGQQRYGAAVWSGDTSSNWDSLRRQIAMSTNYALSGMPYWTMDIGGFFRPSNQYADPDFHLLLTRWFQFAVFTPIFRVHGAGSNTELWNYGQKLQDQIVDSAIRFRYRLLEYIYSGFRRVETEHYTMQRGLVLDFWYDDQVLDIPDEFMFGESFLVAPIHTADSSRSVYLPKLPQGKWRCFWSGNEVQGSQTIQFTNLTESRIPLFVRPSILVLGVDGRQHVQDLVEGDPHKLEVRVYQGADSRFVLFEDDGESADPNRSTSEITFWWDESSRVLRIGTCSRHGDSFPGMAATRTIDIVLVRPDVGVGIDSTLHPDASVLYNGTMVSVKLEPDEEQQLSPRLEQMSST